MSASVTKLETAALRVSAQQNDPGMPGRLRVGLLAGTPARQQALAALVRGAGHLPAPPDGPADVVLIDGMAQRNTGVPSVLLQDGGAGDNDVVLPPSPTPRQLDAALRGAAAGLVVRARPVETGFAPAPNGGLRSPLLTPREVEILLAVGEGLSNKEVARRLGISQHTVKFHLEAVFTKLDAGSRAEAVAKGLRQGLIEL
jgi:DNA-binding CsgD family transcriptional regulator